MWSRYTTIPQVKFLCQCIQKLSLVSDTWNLALGRKTWQSSNCARHGLSHEAVDGNPSGDYLRDFSCTHTMKDDIPWWTVDLGAKYPVSKVVISNRADCCGMYGSFDTDGLSKFNCSTTGPLPQTWAQDYTPYSWAHISI